MKIGLFFGSFNPVHAGHLIIAGYMANFTALDKVWLIVSPQNPLKNKNSLTQVYDRLEMAKLAVDDDEKIEVKDFELKLPQPSYTIDTLTHLKEKYPHDEFILIMGEDNLASLKKWKNYELILRDYQLYVYPRPGVAKTDLHQHTSVTITSTPLMDLSSTFIRKALKEHRNIKYFMPGKVIEFIESKGLYQ